MQLLVLARVVQRNPQPDRLAVHERSELAPEPLPRFRLIFFGDFGVRVFAELALRRQVYCAHQVATQTGERHDRLADVVVRADHVPVVRG